MLRRRLSLVASLAFVLTATACADDSPATPSAGSGRIVVLGDSLATSPSLDKSFPAVLQTRLEQAAPGWRVINRSVSGDTTSGGRARLDSALAEGPEILILELGANDGLRGVDIAVIRANLSEIITRAKNRSVRVLLCGMETFPSRGFQYARDFHNLFPALAAEHDVPLVPFLLSGVFGDPDLNQGDMIHPNAAGAERIAENVWPYLEPMLASKSTP